jgi:hypothetical protein
MELAREHFARAIENRLVERPASRRIATGDRRALSHALAGALLSLMSFWLARDRPGSPEVMDRLFHRLVWTGVAATQDRR